MLSLRPYQRESLDALYDFWDAGGGNGLIVLPTGAGKALLIAALVRELLAKYPDLRVCIVTHSRELVSQDAKELLGYWPGAPVGIYSAGLGRRDTHSRIIVASIQSIWNKVKRTGGFDLVIVDEAHLISRSADTSYGKFLAALRDLTPDMRVVGTTATPYRLDSGRLDEGEGRIFDQIVYDANVGDLINEGYLSPLVSKATVTVLDTTGVPKRGGDFVPGALEAAVNVDAVTQAAVDEMVAYGASRRAWLAFCTGIKHADAVRDALRARGVSCASVSGETPTGERDRLINDFKAGRLRCLTSVGVLSTGFNVPHVDLIALLRPTKSAGLYVQQCGRSLRKAPGKTDALILDFANLVKTHGPLDAITTSGRPAGSGRKMDEDAPRAKECPACQTLAALNARTCVSCGHEWTRDDSPKHEATADAERPILSGASTAPSWLAVSDVKLARHQKPGAPVSLRVEYSCGLTVYREWRCFEHTGYARSKAASWWRRMGGLLPVPETVDEAIARQRELTFPDEIQVRPSGKYHEVVGYRSVEREAA